MKPGMFIALEGIDGAGTTTQAGLLADWFKQRGLPFHRTWEPSPGRVGRIIREYLSGSVDAPDLDRHYHCMALLFAADRLDHLAREVEPRLRNGRHVITDRYLLSSLVYQSLHCDPEWVKAVNAEAVPAHLTFLLDLPVELALERLARRSLFVNPEIYETEDQLEKIKQLYLEAARSLYTDHEIVVVNGAAEPEAVHAEIVGLLDPRLQAHLRSGG